MPDKKAVNKPEETASDKVLNFLKTQGIVLVVDTSPQVKNEADGFVYTVAQSPRVRAVYKSELEKESN